MAGDEQDDATIPASLAEVSRVARPATLLAGRYELLGILGVGGMGAVYRARDIELDELVALKMLSRELATAPGMIERFREEVRLARRVTHPNIARIFDIGTTGDDWFLTMELIDGESLAAVLAREGKLSLAVTVDVMSQVCAGVAAAHSAGIVHRDLKPDNILVRRDRRAVVADFGIARARADHRAGERDKQISGTPAYMAPEQVLAAADIDGRADIYAFGATLFECLTGQLPFEGKSSQEMAFARLDQPPPDPRKLVPDLPETMAEIVLRCTAREKDDRFESFEMVGSALARMRNSLVPAPDSVHEIARHTRFDRSIAVLPISNAGAAQDEYLAATLTDDLADLLSSIGGVRVRKLDSAEIKRTHAGKLTDDDARSLGRGAGVHTVTLGSVTREDHRIRVSLRLITVADGFQLWSTVSHHRPEDFFSIGDEAAAAIANALTGSDVPAPRRIELSSEALTLYLRGRHLLMHGWVGRSPEAASLLQRAHELAPEDVRIAATYGRALVRNYSYGDQECAKRAEKVLESVAHDPEAALGLAALHLHRAENVAGAKLLVKSLARAPSLAGAIEWRGRLLLEMGSIAEARAELLRARELEPLLADVTLEVARSYALMGDLPTALSTLVAGSADTILAPMLSMSAIRFSLWFDDRERAEEFAARFAEAERTDPRMVRIVDGFMDVVRNGTAERFASALALGLRVPRTQATFAQFLTEACAHTGDAAGALAALAEADANGLIDLAWIERCRALSSIRGLSGFEAVAARVRERVGDIREVLAGD